MFLYGIFGTKIVNTAIIAAINIPALLSSEFDLSISFVYSSLITFKKVVAEGYGFVCFSLFSFTESFFVIL